ncbi:MAG TPA: alpha/beta fold hydrolase [Ktedonobacterales bacterium]|nr:alpha/beta fold hydrolase [Ktedonobacterales bacterium]
MGYPEGEPGATRPAEQQPNPAAELTAGPGQTPAPPVKDVVSSEPTGPSGPPARAAKTQPHRGTVRSIHYELSYVVRNEERGPRGAMVLLHDLPGGAFAWHDALPALDGLGRAVYAFDMLGYGDSDRPWPSDTSIWGHADCLSYALKFMNLSEVVLVGVGLGGGVAQVLATRLFREGLAKLVLINTYAYEYAFAPNWPLTEMAKRQDPEAPKHTPADQVLADLRATLPNGSARPKFLAGSKLDAYVDPWQGHLGEELLFQHVRLMLPLYINSITPGMRKLEVPLQIIWGEQDSVTPIELGRRLQRDVSGARLDMVPNAGHLILDDAPDAVGKLIADFAGQPAASDFAVAR